jgi:uroporphyrin-III C-methyltransferase
MHAPLLSSQDVSGQVHLIIGSNPLANARCTRSSEAGAKAIVINHYQGDVHYALQQKVDDGRVELHNRAFRDEDLTTLGREAVDHVVDMVFVTLRDRSTLSTICNYTL